MLTMRVQLELPAWLRAHAASLPGAVDGAEARMRVAVELSRRNVEEGTGGPFGAAIFERDSGRLLSVGVNRVVPAGCSVAHAEIMAIALAQAAVGAYDLGGAGRPACELVTSAEPCAMCLGAVPWSGVRGLVCGARREDAEAAGFDEGDKPADWVAGLERRGIAVTRDVCRAEAAAVLRAYAAGGGPAYNSRGS